MPGEIWDTKLEPLNPTENQRYFTARVPDLRGNNMRARAACPLCESTNASALSIDFAKGLYYCHRCQSGGDAITFERALVGTSFPTARDAVFDLAGKPIPPSSETPAERSRRIQQARRARREAETIAQWRDGCLAALRQRWWRELSYEQRAAWLVQYGGANGVWRENLVDLTFTASKRALELERQIETIAQAPAEVIIAAYQRGPALNRRAA